MLFRSNRSFIQLPSSLLERVRFTPCSCSSTSYIFFRSSSTVALSVGLPASPHIRSATAQIVGRTLEARCFGARGGCGADSTGEIGRASCRERVCQYV